MTSTKPNYQTAADVFDTWRDDLLTGKPPTFYPVGDGELSKIEIGPGIVNLFGGSPGAGKTCFTLQAVCTALQKTPTLRALVCNVEMPPAVLLDRTLARLTGIDLTAIRYRTLDASHGGRLDAGLAKLETFSDRLAFLQQPFDLENVASAADAFGAKLLLLDYAQRIPPPGTHGDTRNAMNATMGYLRQFADAGVAVIVVSRVSRGRDAKGRSSYAADALTLASFSESAELEFGSDSAYLLVNDPKDAETVILRCLKNRHGDTQDLPLHFDKCHQAFAPLDSTAATPKPADGKLTAALRSLWNTTAADEPEGGTDGF